MLFGLGRVEPERCVFLFRVGGQHRLQLFGILYLDVLWPFVVNKIARAVLGKLAQLFVLFNVTSVVLQQFLVLVNTEVFDTHFPHHRVIEPQLFVTQKVHERLHSFLILFRLFEVRFAVGLGLCFGFQQLFNFLLFGRHALIIFWNYANVF